MSTHYIEEAERLADTVTIMSHGKAVAVGPPAAARDRARRPRGDRGLRAAGAAGRGRGARRRGRGLRTRRTGTSVVAARRRRAQRRRCPRASAAPRTSRTSSCCSPGRRSRDRRRARRVAPRPPRAPGDRRRARPRGHQLLVVLARDDVLVDRRADDLPARVRLRLRRARSPRSAAATTSSSSPPARWPPRCCSRRSSRRCSARSSSTSSSAPTTRSWPRRSTPRSSSPPRSLWIAARAGRLRLGAAARRRCVFGLDPAWGMLPVPFIGVHHRLRLGRRSACSSRRVLKSIDNFNYVTSVVITPMFLVAGTFFPLDQLPQWAQALAQLNPLYHCVELVRHAVVRLRGLVDLWHVACLLGFGCRDVAAGDLADGASASIELARIATVSGSCRRSSTSSRPSCCSSSSRRSTSARSSSRGGGMAKRWHPDIAPPGRQLEHERHLKAINEAADQLEQLAEESRGGRVIAQRGEGQRRRRAQAPRRGGRRAPTTRSSASARSSGRPGRATTRSARACPTTRSCTATRAACPIPSGASGRSTASTSPATATTSSSGRACHFHVGVRTVPAGSLQFVDFSKPDPGAERVSAS